jgi:hypothetical protein
MIALWPELVGLLTANLNGALNVFNYGNSTPAPADQDKPWIRTDASGYPTGLWVYKGGFWLQKHPQVPGQVIMWEGDITTLDTFDGGESAVVSLTTGPMWERVTALNGRFPLGIGTQITSGTAITQGLTGGEEDHVLTVSEIPPHMHIVNATPDSSGGTGGDRLRRVTTPANATETTQDTGGGLAHNNLPPWLGIGFIRRSARQYYRI